MNQIGLGVIAVLLVSSMLAAAAPADKGGASFTGENSEPEDFD
jgi:hypothetical protein